MIDTTERGRTLADRVNPGMEATLRDRYVATIAAFAPQDGQTRPPWQV